MLLLDCDCDDLLDSICTVGKLSCKRYGEKVFLQMQPVTERLYVNMCACTYIYVFSSGGWPGQPWEMLEKAAEFILAF